MVPTSVDKAMAVKNPAESLSQSSSVYEETFSEDIFNETRFLDSTEFGDSIETLSFVSASEITTMTEELPTVVEVCPVSKDTDYKFNWSDLFQPKRLHPCLEQVIYWRDLMTSGLIFTGGLSILLAINRFSVGCVLPFLLLQVMSGSMLRRLYINIMRATHCTEVDEGYDPEMVDDEKLALTLSRKNVHNVTSLAVERLNDLISILKDLFLFKNASNTFHFAIILICLAFLGKMINGMVVIMLIYTFVFTIPKLYESHKPLIDIKMDCIRVKMISLVNKFCTAIANGY